MRKHQKVYFLRCHFNISFILYKVKVKNDHSLEYNRLRYVIYNIYSCIGNKVTHPDVNDPVYSFLSGTFSGK